MNGNSQPIFKLQNVLKKYNMKISEEKTKSMSVCSKHLVRARICISNKVIEQVLDFVYLGNHISLFNYQTFRKI